MDADQVTRSVTAAADWYRNFHQHASVQSYPWSMSTSIRSHAPLYRPERPLATFVVTRQSAAVSGTAGPRTGLGVALYRHELGGVPSGATTWIAIGPSPGS